MFNLKLTCLVLSLVLAVYLVLRLPRQKFHHMASWLHFGLGLGCLNVSFVLYPAPIASYLALVAPSCFLLALWNKLEILLESKR